MVKLTKFRGHSECGSKITIRLRMMTVIAGINISRHHSSDSSFVIRFSIFHTSTRRY